MNSEIPIASWPGLTGHTASISNRDATDGWWLLRASNTRAVLVARAEGRDEAGLDRLKGALAHRLEGSGIAAPDFSGENAGH